MKKKLIELKGEIDSSTNLTKIVGGFNTPLLRTGR